MISLKKKFKNKLYFSVYLLDKTCFEKASSFQAVTVSLTLSKDGLTTLFSVSPSQHMGRFVTAMQECLLCSLPHVRI